MIKQSPKLYNSGAENNGMKKVLSLIVVIPIVIVMASLTCVYLSGRIVDPDFFWHLKTGEWLWQHKSLLSEDPFAYTSQGLQSSKAHFILNAYWLTQCLYYFLYTVWGFSGILLLRFVVTGLLIYFMLKRREGDSILYLGLLLTFLIFIIVLYPLDRPQVFSFCFFAILLYLLKGIIDNKIAGKVACISLPLTMLVWANMHGGYVLGVATIALFMVMEAIKYTHTGLHPPLKAAYKRLFIAGMAGIVLSLLNPSGYHAFIEMIRPHPDALFNLEYMSVPRAFAVFNNYIYVFYSVLLLITLLCCVIDIKYGKINISEVALLAGIGYFSFTTIRYIAFFMVAAVPFIGKVLSGKRLLKVSRAAILSIALVGGIYFTWEGRFNLHNLTYGDWVNREDFPIGAAEFVLKNSLEGNMYNSLQWGGYLIWKLSPERKVFIDGRTLFDEVYMQSVIIDTGDKTEIMGMPIWKASLEALNIKYIVTNFYLNDGSIMPLVTELFKDKDWIPVFYDIRALIFLKDGPSNRDVITKYAMPKESVMESLINECDDLIMMNPSSAFPYITKGDLYAISYRIPQAEQMYQTALKIAPLNTEARTKLKNLRR